jgi:hypothetical protein
VDAIDWLLDSDPAIRWQAMRDLTDAPATVLAAERSRIAREGVGAQILATQGADGSWRRPGAPEWMLNVYTVQLLRATGADGADRPIAAALDRIASGFRWHPEVGAKPFFEGEVEPCLNGGTLAAGSYFGRPCDDLARRLVTEQLADGGWNCDAPQSTRSSFHTTICVLEGLLEYERAVGPTPEITKARRRAEEYLLCRSLFRRRSTGEPASPTFLHFAYPPRYCYDVLRALDYFRVAGVPPEPRMGEAVRVIESKRQPDGRWLLEETHNEALPFPFSEVIGKPSRWNTLRALRVVRWYRGEVSCS